MIKKIPVLFFLFISLASFSQGIPDTLILLNGKAILGTLIGDRDGYIEYIPFKPKSKKKQKSKGISPMSVFAIYHGDGTQEIIYEQDKENDFYLTEREMQLFIYGEQDARNYYKTHWVAVIGVAFGFTAGYIFYDDFYVVAAPFLYAVGAGVTKIKVGKGVPRDSEITREPAYQEGFLKIARSKKVFSALAGVLAGTVGGIAVGQLTH